jgi:hypothetical protein
MCDQRPKLNGNLTVRATSATTAHLDWNGGEYSDDASFDPSTCTISHGPPGKTQQVDGVTGHASYKITIDPSGRVTGTAHVNVDIPFAACQADYNVAGSK